MTKNEAIELLDKMKEPYEEAQKYQAFGMNETKLVDGQPKSNEWISCGEQLPDWGTKSYLVCLKNGEIFMALFLSNGKFKEISSMGMRDFCEDNPVIAWRELPNPYQEE